MNEDPQWYVMQGEEQLGPYTGENLMEYAAGGNIVRESLVWTEGMAEWLPAGQIEGLFPPEAAPEPAPAAAVAAYRPGQSALGGATPAYGAATHSALGMQPALGADDPYNCPGIKPASFGLWLLFFLGGLFLTIIGMVMTVSAAATIANAGSEGTAQASGMGTGAIVLLAGCFLTTLSFIPVLICVHRAWQCLQPGGLARSTPGKAVGFLFIPLFNYYWIFQAFNGLAKDWNRTVASYSDLKAAPKMSEGVFLTFCIGNFVPPLGPIMLFPVMSQLCKGINFFAFRPKAGYTGALGGLPGR